jgi:hypothetical protein
VPVKVELPATEFTVNVTVEALLEIPDLLTEHAAGVVEQADEPLVPLLHVPETAEETGAPFTVTVMVTFAVQLRNPFELDAASATAGTAADAATVFEVVALAPSSSVTVRLTVNVPPGAAYACVAVAPVPLVPSPKFHEYDATDPSESVDADPSNEHVSPPHVYVNDAVGGWFGGGPTVVGAKALPETSRRGSWMPSPESSDQFVLPVPTTVEYRPETPA